MMRTIDIARDFARNPAGRYRTDGPASGQRFREEYLEPALAEGGADVILDGVGGLPSSFLEEAVGGLLRAGYEYDQVTSRLKFVAKTSRMAAYPAQIKGYLDDERARILATDAA